MIARTLRDDEADAWNAWLRTVPGSSVRQTIPFREGLTLDGYRSEAIVVEASGRFTAGALVGIRPLPARLGSIVTASGGLAIEDPTDVASLRALVGAILERARRSRAVEIEVAWRVPAEATSATDSVLGELGFTARSHMGTYFVDLRADSEEALLARLGKNPRRHIRKARREGLAIETTLAPEDFEAFSTAHTAMARRKGLPPLPEGFSVRVLLPLARAGLGSLFVARFRGVARNYLFVGDVSAPVYQWGALTDAARDSECPQTGQLLHFAAMLHYRAAGRDYYDFGGSPGPDPDPSHPNFTVWKFKNEFGGRYVVFAGTWKSFPAKARALAVGAIRRVASVRRRIFRR